jgi:hypothetical protein
MDLRPLRRLLLLPFVAIRRFLDWVYAPSPMDGPTRGQATVHLHAAGGGQDSSRWMAIEDEERRRRASDLNRLT